MIINKPLIPTVVASSLITIFLISPFGQVFAQHKKPQNPLKKKVDFAVKKGVKYLTRTQKPNGSWNVKNTRHISDETTGATALVLLALLESGVDPSAPVIQKGMRYLKKQPFKSTYTTGISIMAVERLFIPEEEHKKEGDFLMGRAKTFRYKRREISKDAGEWMVRATKWLLGAMKENGAWHYKGEKDVEVSVQKYTAGGGQKGGLILERRKQKPDDEIIPSSTNNWDHSNTQYGILGFAAAARCGIFVHKKHWTTMLKHWLAHQADKNGAGGLKLNGDNKNDSGSRGRETQVDNDQRGPVPKPWKYDLKYDHDYAMTPVGVASLQLIRHNLKRVGDLPDKLGKKSKMAIYDGLAFIQNNYGEYSLQSPPESKDGSGDYYDMYSIERAMMLSQVRTIGGNNWYVDGANELLDAQNNNGSWGDGDIDTAETCFALLFLKRGTVPVAPIETER